MLVEDEDSPIPLADELFELAEFQTGFEYYASQTGALFSAKAVEGNAVAFWWAAALAAVTGGTLSDPQHGFAVRGATGSAILEELAEHAEFWDDLCSPDGP